MDSRLRGNDGMEDFCLIDGLFLWEKPALQFEKQTAVAWALPTDCFRKNKGRLKTQNLQSVLTNGSLR